MQFPAFTRNSYTRNSVMPLYMHGKKMCLRVVGFIEQNLWSVHGKKHYSVMIEGREWEVRLPGFRSRFNHSLLARPQTNN